MGERYRRLTVQDVSLVLLDMTQTGTVTAGSNESGTIIAPAGYTYQPLMFYFYVPNAAGSTSGDQRMFLQNAAKTDYYYMYLKSNFGNALDWDYNSAQVVDTKRPNDDAEINRVIRNLWIDSTTSVILNYQNTTDANQTNDRDCYFLMKKVKVS